MSPQSDNAKCSMWSGGGLLSFDLTSSSSLSMLSQLLELFFLFFVLLGVKRVLEVALMGDARDESVLVGAG